jgi:hypothetical protein
MYPGLRSPEFPLRSDSKPELKVRSFGNVTCGYNGEFKTAGDKRLFDGAADYGLWEILWSTFTEAQGHNRVSRLDRYYFEVPHAYVICGAPPTGFLLKIEMAGRAFLSVASDCFYLGSDKHKHIIANLPSPRYEPAIDLTGVVTQPVWNDRAAAEAHVPAAPHTPQLLSHRQHTSFTITCPPDGNFYKIKGWQAYGPRQFLDCVRAYDAYKKARESSVAIPSCLLAADLLYGFGKILIRMPFCQGCRPATAADFDNDALMRLVVDSIVWLARHDLAYIDLRPPNVLVSQDTIFLVDYDDMLLCNGLGDRIKACEASQSAETLRDVLNDFFRDSDRKPYFLRTEYGTHFSKILNILGALPERNLPVKRRHSDLLIQ